jgi:hypothetical protein
MSSPGVIFTWGRMNPPTAGHLLLIREMLREARTRGLTPYVFVSKSYQTNNKKNPISANLKVETLKNMIFTTNGNPKSSNYIGLIPNHILNIRSYGNIMGKFSKNQPRLMVRGINQEPNAFSVPNKIEVGEPRLNKTALKKYIENGTIPNNNKSKSGSLAREIALRGNRNKLRRVIPVSDVLLNRIISQIQTNANRTVAQGKKRPASAPASVKPPRKR